MVPTIEVYYWILVLLIVAEFYKASSLAHPYSENLARLVKFTSVCLLFVKCHFKQKSIK